MSRQRTIELIHDTGKAEETWELDVIYWSGHKQAWENPSEGLEFEIEKATNLETKEILSESAFYKKIGEDGRLTIEDMMMDADQDDYADYCDRQYDEWRDRQMED